MSTEPPGTRRRANPPRADSSSALGTPSNSGDSDKRKTNVPRGRSKRRCVTRDTSQDAITARRAGRAVWLISVRDLAWRRRRFAIAVAATGLVFALALLLSGISASFDNEIRRTTASFSADQWYVSAGTFGPFTAPSAFPESRVRAVRSLPGVVRADPVAIVSATTTTPRRRSVNLIGAVPPGGGPAAEGLLTGARDALADASLGLGVGDELTLKGAVFIVRGVTHGRTYFAGIPTCVVAPGAAE